MRWEKFLNPSSRQSQVGLCQVTAKLSAEFWSSVGGRVGRPTLAGNVLYHHENSYLQEYQKGKKVYFTFFKIVDMLKNKTIAREHGY